MDKLNAFIKGHKKGAVLALFFLIVFIGCSAVSAVHIAQQRAEEASVQSENASSEADGKAEDKKVALSTTQKELIGSYDDETRKLIDTLSASVWSADGGKYTVRFEDTFYTETVDGKEQTHPYAISAIETRGNNSDTDIKTIVFETDTGAHILTYALTTTPEDAQSGTPALCTIESSTMFSRSDIVYERVDAVKQIKIAGLNSEITKLLGDDTEKLTKELSNWCSVHFPVASQATWDKSAFIDYEDNTIMLGFSIGDDSSGQNSSSGASVISVVYNRADGTYSFGK